MKLTKNQKVYETLLVRVRTLDSIRISSLGLLAIPGVTFIDMLINSKEGDLYAFLAAVSIVCFRAFLAGVLCKSQFRLELAKLELDKEQNAP